MNYLTSDDIDHFNQEGCLIFEGLLDHALNQRLKADVDQLMVERQKGERPILMTYPELGPLTSKPRVVDRVANLMGGQKLTHHHIHARWQIPGGGEYKRYFIDTSYCQVGILWGDIPTSKRSIVLPLKRAGIVRENTPFSTIPVSSLTDGAICSDSKP